MIQGNSFSLMPNQTGTGTTGVAVPGAFTYGVVTGNTFSGLAASSPNPAHPLAIGVDLTGATGWNVQANVYDTVTTKVVTGTGNSCGVATL